MLWALAQAEGGKALLVQEQPLFRDRLGCFRFRSAFASICLIRSLASESLLRHLWIRALNSARDVRNCSGRGTATHLARSREFGRRPCSAAGVPGSSVGQLSHPLP